MQDLAQSQSAHYFFTSSFLSPVPILTQKNDSIPVTPVVPGKPACSNMANIPAAIEAADAAGRIPAGISLEYLAQSRDRPAKIAIIFVCALTTLVVIARCYARIFFLKRFGMDDSLAVFTLVILSAVTGRESLH